MAIKREREIKLPPINYELPCPTLSDFGGELYLKRYKEDIYPNNDDVVFLNGIGSISTADILFLTTSPLKEDVDDYCSSPMHLKSGPGEMFRSICLSHGLDLDNHYFTSIIKYVKPKSTKLGKTDINYCAKLLEEEFSYCHPKIIVCIGREAADLILGYRISVSKLEEAWFFSDKYNAHVFVISSIFSAFYKPELYDKLNKEVEMLVDFYDHFARGEEIKRIPCNYRCISTYKDLTDWIEYLKQGGWKEFGVDCEWGKQCYVDGYLRSIQFSWAPGEAAYINFNNEQAQWVFDEPKEKITKVLQDFFNQPDIHYIGHNGEADAQWMLSHLGLDVYDGKFIFDTMFAVQTFDEYADQKLEKLAAKYTDKGRYDIDLIIWKKTNNGIKFDEDEGYGQVPLEILYPYGCSDADVTFRLYPIFKEALIKDGTYDYFMKIKLPFVTEGFTSMSYAGLPFDTNDANKARIAYLASGVVMQRLFRKMLKEEAYTLFYTNVSKLKQQAPISNVVEIQRYFSEGRSFDEIFGLLKKLYKRDAFYLLPYLKHYYNIDNFNPNSPDHKKQWLFEVKGYTPIKTTKPEDGNAIEWEKVLKLPPAKQKDYQPAVDKDTLKVYADKGDDLCLHLLQMNAINQITKNFLKGEEGGLQKFLMSDGKLHTNYVLTESSRPRSFKPNILNIPRYVTDYIKNGFKKVVKYFNIELDEDGKVKPGYDEENFRSIVEELRTIYNIKEDITINELVPAPMRWCFKAPEGYCFVDADYATAEVWTIAYLSGDKNLINTLTKPDPQFAFLKMPDGKEKQVRIAYIDEIVEFTEDAKDPSLLHDPNDPNLVRNPDGTLKHPKQDVHWVAVENKYMLNTPREKLDKNKTRDAAGKVSNFCSGKDNYILTYSNGYKKASEIKVGEVLRGLRGRTTVKSVTRLNQRDCIELQLDSGIIATFHKMHRLKCWNGKSLVWKRVKNLTPEDQIITCRAKNNITYEPSTICVDSNIDINAEDFAYLIGMYINGGDIDILNDSYIIRHQIPIFLKDKFLEVLNNLELKYSIIDTEDYCIITYGEHGLGKFIYENFGKGDKKHLPQFVFSQWSEDTVVSFIRGLKLTEKIVIGLSYTCIVYSKNFKFLSDIAVLAHTVRLRTTLQDTNYRLLIHLDFDSDLAKALILSKDAKLSLKSTWFPSKILSKRELKEDIIAIECTTHEYIDMSLNSHNSIPYGASPSLLERSIEIASGEKPEKGTGEKLIEAYMKTKPQVAEFLEWCKTLPDGQGYYLSPSGFKRHFKVPPEDLMMSDKQREGIISKLRREACNIGLQSLVADSLARAVPPLNNFFRKMNMKSRVVIPLYDAIYILAPFNEVDTAARMLKFFMSENNKWNLKGGTLQYGIDVEITKRWGTKPSKEEKEELKNGLKNAGQKMEV